MLQLSPALAESGGAIDYGFLLAFERYALDGLSLGDDQAGDRLVEQDYEFEFNLEYTLADNAYLFFTGALIDETETVENAGLEEVVSGLERKEMGVGYFFGNAIQSELKLGRMEFASVSEWWLWWDEELDAIRLESTFGDFEAMLGLAEEQARESTGVDFIDPEFDGVKRVMFSLVWEVAANQSLMLCYLDQSDDSESFNVGEFEDAERIDEEDADLTWSGISYLGEFDLDTVGEIALEAHLAWVSGNETVYEFDDPVAGMSEVIDLERNKVSGSARAFLIDWSPAALDDWSLVLGRASGSGDANPDDNRVKSFRQPGLQGYSESFGELYQPELSNLTVNLIGVEWEIADSVELAVLRYKYQQRKRADEMRDVSIDLDLNGSSRDLGHETDLVVTIEAREGLEVIVTAAEFDPGEAYGAFSGETASFVNFELTYEF
jgi:hypothetical protein